MNLKDTITDLVQSVPPTYVRLADDLEWSQKRWTFITDITGALAKWAVRQSPYRCAENIEAVIRYLDCCLKKSYFKDEPMLELSLCEVNEMCHKILNDFPYFTAWNQARKGKTPDILFTGAISKVHPDYDFIDLHALLHNVCLDIRMERRAFDAFNDEFDKNHSPVI